MPLLPALILALAALATENPPALVLRSGVTIPVSGRITEVGQTLIFRSNGTLYSIRNSEVDFELTNRLAEESLRPKKEESNVAALKVSAEERDRLLKELEKSRAAAPSIASLAQQRPTPPATRELVVPERRAAADTKDEERYWRHRSKSYEENLRQRQEDLDFLRKKEQRLEDDILGFLSLGYKPNQFSYQVRELERAREDQERAELELRRAQRQLEEFQDEARREGILPGWLR
jgi:hypothetical protein